MNKTLIWIALMFMVLIHVQLNYHSSFYFVLASLLCGAIPLRNMSWVKYFGIEILALIICFLLQNPGSDVFIQTIGEITKMNYWVYVGLTLIVSSVLFATLASTMYFLLAKPFLYDFFGIALADKEKAE